MSEEEKITETPQTDGPPPDDTDPLLPEVPNMTVDAVRNHIWNLCGRSTTKDDPLFMMVGINNAFLEENATWHGKYYNAFKKFLASETARFSEAVSSAAGSITQSLSALTTKGINDAVKDMVALNTSVKYCTIICAASAIVSAADLVVRILTK